MTTWNGRTGSSPTWTPARQIGWTGVERAARDVRAALAARDLEYCVRTTGGRGIHMVVPRVPDADWSERLAFSRALSDAIVRADPDRYTTDVAKAGRARTIPIGSQVRHS